MNKQSLPLFIITKRLLHGAGLPLPQRMTQGSSGCDVCAAVSEPIQILPGGRALIPTGFCLEIPVGYEVQVRPRSGLAIKQGITILNAPGTIDADYRGEVKVILVNFGDQPFSINRGDRIAQLVPMKVASGLEFSENETIAESQRGDGGFGHTGMQ
jgi:dUTP pyrophosphatase